MENIYFTEQLERCGVEYFDVYLLHWLNRENYEIAKQYGEFAFLQQMKNEGKAKRIGFSYHDSAALLDRILAEHPKDDWKIRPVYDEVATVHGKASECIGCRNCERHCPQKLKISRFLQDVSVKFE